MTSGQRIVLTRWSPVTAAVTIVITVVLAAGPLIALRTAETVGERVFLSVLGVVFGAPLLWALWRTPKALRGMGILVDDTGIHEFDGKRTDTVAWSDIARVGFGSYSRTYRGLRTKSMPGLEVYRKGDDEPAFRCTVSPYGKDAELIEQAVRRFHPELWSGPFVHER
jgi:hypothetical protein